MDYDQPAAGSTVPFQGSALDVNRDLTNERIEAETMKPELSHSTSAPREQTDPDTDNFNTLFVADSEMMDHTVRDISGESKPSLSLPPPGPAHNGTQQGFGQLTHSSEPPNNAQPNHAETSSTLPPKPQRGNSPRTYEAIIDDMGAAIQRGDGEEAATLIRAAVDKKTSEVAPHPPLTKKEKKALRSGKASPHTIRAKVLRKHKELSVHIVRHVVETHVRARLHRQAIARDESHGRHPDGAALARRHARIHAREITNEACKQRRRTVVVDLVAREEVRRQRVHGAIREKCRATDELRARLEEMGDGVLPPRSAYLVDDTMMVCEIEAVKFREIGELKRHLKYFTGNLDSGNAAKLPKGLERRINMHQESENDMNNLMDGMSKMSGFSWAKPDNVDEADQDNEDMDMVM